MVRAFLIATAGLAGVALTLWHRRLMLALNARHPGEWERLREPGLLGKVWTYSVRYPFWSWKSISYFVTGAYKRLDDPSFAARAGRFRIALIVWIAALCVAGFVNMLVL